MLSDADKERARELCALGRFGTSREDKIAALCLLAKYRAELERLEGENTVLRGVMRLCYDSIANVFDEPSSLDWANLKNAKRRAGEVMNNA